MLRRIVLLGQGQGIFYMLYTEYYAVLSLARLCPALTIIGQAHPNLFGPHACQRIFTALWSMQIWPDWPRVLDCGSGFWGQLCRLRDMAQQEYEVFGAGMLPVTNSGCHIVRGWIFQGCLNWSVGTYYLVVLV